VDEQRKDVILFAATRLCARMMIAMIDSDKTNFGKQYFLTGRDRGSWICTDARQDGYSAAAGSMLQRLVAFGGYLRRSATAFVRPDVDLPN
jgi:hypothetical protein